MSPTRYSSLFRKSWTALAWAAGICWTAIETTSCMDLGPDTQAAAPTNAAAGDAADAANLNQLESLVAKLEK